MERAAGLLKSDSCDGVSGRRRRQSVSGDRNSTSALDCGKANLERPEGISVLQEAETGINENSALGYAVIRIGLQWNEE